ncbi:quinone oxidoreductase, YhdH/YhfP family protein [Staphylococcus aureus]|nr:quinone oxidoreductase, YhdH/YhfP family protein [Staphylococcus aureus]
MALILYMLIIISGEDIWSKLANEWNIGNSLLYNEIGFEEFYKTIDQLLKGQHLGRTILKV